MDIGIIATRYAKALVKYAEEQSAEEAVYTDLCLLTESFKRVPALHSYLTNPALTSTTKLDLLKTAMGGEAASQVTQRFMVVVLENNRMELINFIALSYITLYRKKKKLTHGRLTVATPIADSTAQRFAAIVEKQTKHNVEFEVKIDANIDGGFILEFDTYRIDASLRNQFAQISRSLMSVNQKSN